MVLAWRRHKSRRLSRTTITYSPLPAATGRTICSSIDDDKLGAYAQVPCSGPYGPVVAGHPPGNVFIHLPTAPGDDLHGQRHHGRGGRRTRRRIVCDGRRHLHPARRRPGGQRLARGGRHPAAPRATYLLTIQGRNEDQAKTGDLDITDDLTINGASNDPNSASATVIDAGGTLSGNTGIDRVFDIPTSGINATLSNLVVQGGNTDSSSTLGGAGIKNEGNLTLIDVLVSKQ